VLAANITSCSGLCRLPRRNDTDPNRALDNIQTWDPVNVAYRHGLNVDCQIQVVGDRPLRGAQPRTAALHPPARRRLARWGAQLQLYLAAQPLCVRLRQMRLQPPPRAAAVMPSVTPTLMHTSLQTLRVPQACYYHLRISAMPSMWRASQPATLMATVHQHNFTRLTAARQ
jgi:hypothetical protein